MSRRRDEPDEHNPIAGLTTLGGKFGLDTRPFSLARRGDRRHVRCCSCAHDPISAEEAYEFGLVNRLVADHELFDTALAWARKFAGQAPVAIEQIKRVSHAGDLDEGIEAEKAAFATAFGSADAREGIGAFLQKRKPEFKGR